MVNTDTPLPTTTADEPSLQALGRVGIVPGHTILLVEDDPEVRDVCVAILRRFGYTVLTADSDCKASWVWDKHKAEIELLVSDIMIPTCATGLDLAKRFHEEKPSLKIAFTSGFSKEIAGEEMELVNASPYLRKPFSALQLMQLVWECLGQSDPSEAASASLAV